MNDSLSMEWVEGEPPPTKGRGRPSPWPARLAKLDERPGVWAKFGPVSKNQTGGLSKQRKEFPTHEFISRTVDGQCFIFARRRTLAAAS